MKKNYFLFLIAFLLIGFIKLKSQTLGNAIVLNGTSEYITVPNPQNEAIGNGSFTIECWIKLSSSASVYGKDRILMPNVYNGVGVFIEANKLVISKVGVNEKSSTGKIQDVLWHHVAFTFDGSKVKFYIDGVYDSEQSYSPNFSSNMSDFTIGGFNNSELFTGNIDELRIWKVVRTDNEINTNKCVELNGNEPNLIRYYKFNETSGTTVADATSNAANGTITSSGNIFVNSQNSCTPSSSNSLTNFENEVLSIYPNPANDNLFLTNNSSFINAKIYNMLGELVLEQILFSNEKSISIASLKNGVYFVSISGELELKVFKFVKE